MSRGSTTVLATAAALACAAPAVAAAPIFHPHAHPYGQSLRGWSEDYWRWNLTGGYAATTPFRPGSAPVVFMPLPQGVPISGSGTSEDPIYLQGTIEVTIQHGTGFVLPMFAWIAETYNTGQPNDPPVPNQFITTVATNLDRTGVPDITVDGRRELRNFWQYYVGPRCFNPPVVYSQPSSYGSTGAVTYQGVTAVFKPMCPGTHEIHLLERLTLTNATYPGFAFPIDLGIIYDNTWIIHVE